MDASKTLHSKLRIWLNAARPRTLPAAVAPVVAASAIAVQNGIFQRTPVIFCTLFALLIQISTNFANDYFDALKGADTPDRKGPERAVSSGLISPPHMLIAVFLALSLAFISGLFLINYGGLIMLPIGIVCMILAVAYTGGPFPLAYLGLGDLFVFAFFGLLAVTVTYYVQAGEISQASIWAGIGCGLLASNILVVNNYRDMETDATAGKRTTTVRFGRKFSLKQYTLSIIFATLTCIPLYALGFSWPIFSLLLLIAPGLKLAVSLSRADPVQCNPLLGKSANLLLAYPVLLLICSVTS